MSEPKFRGFNKKTNSWHYGFGWCEVDYTEEFLKERNISKQAMLYTESGPIECELDSMDQYTGFKDRYKKEIYNSDILLDHNCTVGKVFYYDGGYKLSSDQCVLDLENINSYDFLNQSLMDDNEFEIIGNIYESPELLKGESE